MFLTSIILFKDNLCHFLYDNDNNNIQQLARQSKAPQKVTNFFGDPALPASLREYFYNNTDNKRQQLGQLFFDPKIIGFIVRANAR